MMLYMRKTNTTDSLIPIARDSMFYPFDMPNYLLDLLYRMGVTSFRGIINSNDPQCPHIPRRLFVR